MPEIVELPDRPYVGVRGAITMNTIPVIADRIGEIAGWLLGRGAAIAGAPFLRYESFDTEGDGLVMQAGVPVAGPVEAEGDYFAGVLPAGRYATLTHRGHFDGLIEATRVLLAWGEEQGLKWDMTEGDGAEHWGCRLEVYNTDPRVENDPANFLTDLQIRLS
ncbi:GyrI-like domain-containing protein [Nonomuraea sp. NPDC049419]|uniref:GyrI-like domain-containing protein n=1 Tax=Nonomuraea sp. NPDC049419 TaxID=3155772 RepID=UPI00341E574E